MLKPEQIPNEVFEAFKRAWADRATLSTKECFAISLNAWPGMERFSGYEYGVPDVIHLPITTEPSDGQ